MKMKKFLLIMAAACVVVYRVKDGVSSADI